MKNELLEKTIAAQTKAEDRVHVVGINSKTGNAVVVVDMGGSGGGRSGSPQYVGVAEIKPGTAYISKVGANVMKYQSVGKYNSLGGRGPTSNYAKYHTQAEELAAKVVAGRAALGRGAEL